jgi:hypothetical protein
MKLTFYEALINSVMTYAYSAWEFVAETLLLKLLHLQNEDLCVTGNVPRCRSVHELHVAFNLPYVHDYITEVCRQQAEIIQNHKNENIRNIDQGEPLAP